MSRSLLLILIILVLVTSVSAFITIDSPDELYNLGDSAEISFSVGRDDDFSGLVSVGILCPSLELSYYTTIISLSDNKTKKGEAPVLSFIDGMKGNCVFKVSLNSFANELIEENQTEKVNITDSFDVNMSYEQQAYSPGDKLTLDGEIFPTYKSFSSATMSIDLGEVVEEKITKKDFSVKTTIPDHAPSSLTEMTITIEDTFGNTGVYRGPILITQVPSDILIDLSKDSYEPNTTMQAVVKYVDQANVTIPEPIDVKLYGPKGLILRDLLYNATVTDNLFVYHLSSSIEPGGYLLEFVAGTITKEFIFNVTEDKSLRFGLIRV